MSYASHLNDSNKKNAGQGEPRDARQTRNWGGGYSYEVGCFDQLRRFLVLGSEGGNYYANERQLTLDNVSSLDEALSEDPEKAVELIRKISIERRGISNNTCIFALAYVLDQTRGEAREKAADAVLDICRTGSHILRLVDELNELGWSPAKRRAARQWYEDKSTAELAYQMAKYQNRHGWSHRDAMLMLSPDFDRDEETARNALFEWACGRWDEVDGRTKRSSALERIRKTEQINEIQETERAAELINEGELPREMVPGRLRGSKEVWASLLFVGEGMPVWAMLRNLGKMSEVGLFDDPDAEKKVLDTLVDPEAIRGSGVHPTKVLTARLMYASGRSMRGSLSWPVNDDIVEALERAFYLSFANVDPADDRFLLALDVSGSMTSQISGHAITAMQSAAVMAMTRVRAENEGDGSVQTIAFSDGSNGRRSRARGSAYEPAQFPLSVDDSFDEVLGRMDQLSFAATDCALPMNYARQQQIPVDTFVVYTDSETNVHRSVHPQEALERYREEMGIPAKMIVVGLQSNGFTIADPDDPLAMDVVGWDSQLPEIINTHIEEGNELLTN